MISLLSIIPIRSEAAESSEMVSQILFGEEVELIEKTESWSKIQCLHDNYQGWVDTKMLADVSMAGAKMGVVSSITATLRSNNISFPITMGALLPLEKNGKIVFGDVSFELLAGDVATKVLNTEQALETVLKLQNAPYLWGGRSSFGIDCSGFSQLYYRLLGKQIPRDASQQIVLGEDVFLSEAQTGDLAFFEKKGRVTHVGVLMDNTTIIHASGCVRIDAIDANGIYVKEEQKYSHKLVGVKRL